MAFLLNGEHISNERLYREFLTLSGGQTPDQLRQKSVTAMAHLREIAERNVLRSALLLQYARQERLEVTAREVEEARRAAWRSTANQACGAGIADDMAERALLQKVEQHVTRHVPRPGQRELQALYQANPGAFQKPETWLVSHIIKIAETVAERKIARDVLEEALAELAEARSFAHVAERYSDCKGNAGSLGWVARGSMVAAFEDQVFGLELGRPSGVFETIFGLHIAIVWEHKAAGLPPFQEIRGELAKRVMDERRNVVMNRAVEALFRSATIQVISEPERNITRGERMQ